MQIILFEFNGSICTLTPGVGTGMTLLETGQRDAPISVPFWIVNPENLPNDSPTEAWEIDIEAMGEPAGYGGTYVENVRGEGND